MNQIDQAKRLGQFLSHLMNGGRLEVNGQVFVWHDNQVCLLPFDLEGNIVEDHPLGMGDVPLSFWLNLMDKISEDDWFILSAQMALSQVRSERLN